MADSLQDMKKEIVEKKRQELLRKGYKSGIRDTE